VVQVAPIQAPIRLPAKVHDHEPVRSQGANGYSGQPGGQRGEDHDQTHRLVHDHGLEGEEPENPDQQRQSELGAAEADEPAENADSSAGDECGR
jgi:hypothetical protein